MESTTEIIQALTRAASANSSREDLITFRNLLFQLVRKAQEEKMRELTADFESVERAASKNFRH